MVLTGLAGSGRQGSVEARDGGFSLRARAGSAARSQRPERGLDQQTHPWRCSRGLLGGVTAHIEGVIEQPLIENVNGDHV